MKPLILLAAIALSGCAALEGQGGLALLEKASQGAEKVEDATLGNAMKAVPIYCNAPGTLRTDFRNRANARPEAEDGKLGVWCPGDPTLVLGP